MYQVAALHVPAGQAGQAPAPIPYGETGVLLNSAVRTALSDACGFRPAVDAVGASVPYCDRVEWVIGHLRILARLAAEAGPRMPSTHLPLLVLDGGTLQARESAARAESAPADAELYLITERDRGGADVPRLETAIRAFLASVQPQPACTLTLVVGRAGRPPTLKANEPSLDMSARPISVAAGRHVHRSLAAELSALDAAQPVRASLMESLSLLAGRLRHGNLSAKTLRALYAADEVAQACRGLRASLEDVSFALRQGLSTELAMHVVRHAVRHAMRAIADSPAAPEPNAADPAGKAIILASPPAAATMWQLAGDGRIGRADEAAAEIRAWTALATVLEPLEEATDAAELAAHARRLASCLQEGRLDDVALRQMRPMLFQIFTRIIPAELISMALELDAARIPAPEAISALREQLITLKGAIAGHEVPAAAADRLWSDVGALQARLSDALAAQDARAVLGIIALLGAAADQYASAVEQDRP